MNQPNEISSGLAIAAILVCGGSQAVSQDKIEATQARVAQAPLTYIGISEEVLRCPVPPVANREMVSLHAYGQTWTASIGVKDHVCAIKLPAVRVPIRFDLKSSTKVHGSVVVYPKQYRLPWRRRLHIQSADKRDSWLTQWLRCTGAPIEEATQQVNARDSSDWRLLVGTDDLGGDSPAAFVRRLRTNGSPALLLSASWLGSYRPNGTPLSPSPLMSSETPSAGDSARVRWTGPLAMIATQRWPAALTVTRVRGPWPGVANRWPWLAIDEQVVCEQVRTSADSRHAGAVICGLPWEQMIGTETADHLLLEILHAAARPVSSSTSSAELSVPMQLIPRRPSDRVLRPILSAAVRNRAQADVRQPALRVIDLRGPDLAGAAFRELPKRLDPKARWLILGADSRWSSSSVERQHSATAENEHMIRILNDELPSPPAIQQQLMSVLTREGVMVGSL